MKKKLHTPKVVQELLNRAMAWAQKELAETGRIPAATLGVLANGGEVTLHPSSDPNRTVAAQEASLVHEARAAWQTGSVAALALVVPVLYGKAGSGERNLAVRLHMEAPSYCADILMPYRVRPAPRWRGKGQNRVHFSHPVAVEAESWFMDFSASQPARLGD